MAFENHSIEDLKKFVDAKREELRALRFSVAGSKNHNVKQAGSLKREIAQALTVLNARKEITLRQAQGK